MSSKFGNNNDIMLCLVCDVCYLQYYVFLSEVNNRETIVAIEANNDSYFLQKRIEKFPLIDIDDEFGNVYRNTVSSGRIVDSMAHMMH